MSTLNGKQFNNNQYEMNMLLHNTNSNESKITEGKIIYSNMKPKVNDQQELNNVQRS